MSYSLGVDLGTTFVAAAVARGSRVEMVTLGDRMVVTPAVVYARDDGSLVTGEAANRRAVSNPDRVAREFKRRLGDPTPVMLGGAPHAVTALLAELLAETVAKVTETEGAPPRDVVLTHPANWGPYRRELFEEVPQLGGVPKARMITEPEAAAAHYAAARHLADGDTVAVYDLGGGTFDATVLRKRAVGIDILGSPEGIECLGGVDFDDAILAHINFSSGGALSELDMSNPQTGIALARLRRDCIAAKEALSVDTEAAIPVFLPNRHFDVRLTRSEFEDMIRAQIESTIGALTRTLRSARVEPTDLNAVLLIGGSSRIPLVAQMITAALNRPTLVDAHPKYAVALGAAILAAELGPQSRSAPTAASYAPTPVAPATSAAATSRPPGSPTASEAPAMAASQAPVTVPVVPPPSPAAPVAPPAPAAPETALASGLAAVLAEALGVAAVPVDGNFFNDLGADSMVMARFCARLRKRDNLPAPSMKDVYANPTVAQLAALFAPALAPAALPASADPLAAEFAGVLAEVLGVASVPVDGNFFNDLGADSMVMARFCARLRKRDDLPTLSITDVYANPSAAKLAASFAPAAAKAMLVTAAVEPHEQPMITAGVAQHRASRISEGAPEGDRTTASYEYADTDVRPEASAGGTQHASELNLSAPEGSMTESAPGHTGTHDDDVQFTVYRPALITPLEWRDLLVYTHPPSPFVEPETGRTIDPEHEVVADARRRLPPGHAYRRSITDSTDRIPRLEELVLQPWLSEGFIDPPHRTLKWHGTVQRADFRICAPANPSNQRIDGGVRFFLGPVIIAEAKFKIDIADTATCMEERMKADQVKRYRRIFVSYSHDDHDIVQAVKDYNLTGDEYLIDLVSLRPGSDWQSELLQLIDQSDIFQLFWSRNAMGSPHVRREWEHALSLRRPGFVCPVYWEDPRPVDPDRELPPRDLEQLHWAKLPLSRIPHSELKADGESNTSIATLPKHATPPPPAVCGPDREPTSSAAQDTTRSPDPFAQSAGPPQPAPQPSPPNQPGPPPGCPVPVAPATRAGDTWAGHDMPSLSAPHTGSYRGKPASSKHTASSHRRHLALVPVALVVLLFIVGSTSYFLLRPSATITADGGPRSSPVLLPPPAERPAEQQLEIKPSRPIPAIVGEIPVGNTPGFVAIAPKGTFAYIANRTAGVVTVVDTAIDKVVATIPIPDGPPQYLAFAPDGTRLYVSIFNNPDRSINHVAVLDTQTNTVLTTVKVGTRPYALAVKPDGSEIYVPNRDSGTISVIDTKTNTLVTDIQVKPNPRWVDFSKDGTKAYTTDSESNLVSVIDTTTRDVVAEIPVEKSPYSIAVHPTKPLVANVNYDSNSVTVIDTTTDKVIATIPVGTHPQDVTWAPDGQHMYVTNVDSDNMTVIATDSWKVTATIPTGEEPTSIAVLPNGTKGYVSNLSSGTLTVLGLSS